MMESFPQTPPYSFYSSALSRQPTTPENAPQFNPQFANISPFRNIPRSVTPPCTPKRRFDEPPVVSRNVTPLPRSSAHMVPPLGYMMQPPVPRAPVTPTDQDQYFSVSTANWAPFAVLRLRALIELLGIEDSNDQPVFATRTERQTTCKPCIRQNSLTSVRSQRAPEDLTVEYLNEVLRNGPTSLERHPRTQLSSVNRELEILKRQQLDINKTAKLKFEHTATMVCYDYQDKARRLWSNHPQHLATYLSNRETSKPEVLKDPGLNHLSPRLPQTSQLSEMFLPEPSNALVQTGNESPKQRGLLFPSPVFDPRNVPRGSPIVSSMERLRLRPSEMITRGPVWMGGNTNSPYHSSIAASTEFHRRPVQYPPGSESRDVLVGGV